MKARRVLWSASMPVIGEIVVTAALMIMKTNVRLTMVLDVVAAAVGRERLKDTNLGDAVRCRGPFLFALSPFCFLPWLNRWGLPFGSPMSEDTGSPSG